MSGLAYMMILMQSSLPLTDARLAVALRLGEEDWPLKELYADVSEELDIPWAEVRAAYRDLRIHGWASSIRQANGEWVGMAADNIAVWIDSNIRLQMSTPEPVRFEGENLPTEHWRSLMRAFRRGEMGIAFFPAGAPVVAFKHPDTGKMVKINGPD